VQELIRQGLPADLSLLIGGMAVGLFRAGLAIVRSGIYIPCSRG
jgi:hypothetical protein